MKKRKAPASNRSNRRRPKNDRNTIRAVLITFVCGGLVLAGIFFAASQHFSAMNIGMENSKLRKQLEDFKAENRRLTLAKEVAMSPAEITRLASEIGLGTPRPIEVAASKQAETVSEKALEETAAKPAAVELASVKENSDEKRARIAKPETASLKKNAKSDEHRDVVVIKTVETRPTTAKTKPAKKKTNAEAEKVKDGTSRPRIITVAKLR